MRTIAKTMINLGVVAPAGITYGALRDADKILEELEPKGAISTAVVTARDATIGEMFTISASLPRMAVLEAKEFYNGDSQKQGHEEPRV